MSRHGGNAGRRLPLFQLEVVDYSKRRNGSRSSNFDGTCSIGFAMGDKEKFGVKKIADMPVSPPHRTLMERFKDGKAAMRWGRRFGTVISCRKIGMSEDRSVSMSPYLKNIEYLNLAGKPIAIEIEKEEYVVSKSLELSHPRIDYEHKKFNVQIVDNEEGV